MLDRVVPASALPRATRDLICDEQGHDALGDGTCRRCGAELPEKEHDDEYRYEYPEEVE